MSTEVRAASNIPEQIEVIKNVVVMYIGSPNAIVCGNNVQIDKQYLEVVPILHEKGILIPLRITAEGLGAKVEWDGKTKSITVIQGKKEVKLKQGSDIIIIDEVESKMNLPVMEIKGRTFVPLAEFAEALGVSYVNIDNLIIIGSAEDVKRLTDRENNDIVQNLIDQIGVLPVIGSYDKLVELLQSYTNVNLVRYRGGEEVFAEFDVDMAMSGSAVEKESSTASASYSGASQKAKANSSVASAPEAPQNIQDSQTMHGAMDSESTPDYSTTNVQVEGVDEADIIKTDGRYIYQVNRQRVVITRAYPAEDMKVESIISFNTEDFNPLEMYLDNDKLIVIGNSYAKYESVKVFVFDIKDKTNPVEIRNFEVEGNYISSRKIGNYLYLVANKYMDFYRILNDKNVKPAPFYKDSVIGKETIDIDLKHVHYFPGHIHPNYMIVAGINVVENDEKAQVSTFLGSGQNIYASLKNLYVAVTDYQPIIKVNTPVNEIDIESNGSTKSKSTVEPVTVTAEPGIVNNVTVTIKPGKVIAVEPIVMQQENTLIYKFSLNNGNVNYISRGSVPGRILNQFSMDEHEDYFRIATTTGDIWRDDEFTSKNNIYVLDSMMNTVGSVEDIAPGEQIYSVRFMGDRAYMVTFKLTDPLFVIDLKNAREPRILGALKIPGYSDYLHPYDENHIIGFGKDSVEVKGQAFYTGMKIAMFDVSDVSNPVLKFSEIIGDRGTESELLRNHKALLFSKEKGIMAFPVTVMEIKSGNKLDQNGIPNYGEFTFQGAYVYSIDPIKGFELKGRITHLSKDDMLKSGVYWYNSDKNINRIIYIGNNLYTISNKILMANKLEDMRQINMIEIP